MSLAILEIWVAMQPHRSARLSPRLAFAAVAAVIGLALFASATPSALYGVYAARWHFSTPVLTLVYGVYAAGVLASLLLIGGLSDQVGRRPVLLGSLALLLAAMVLFALARSVVWLFAARALQGVATGAALGAAGAALLELHPRGDTRQAALVNGAVSNVGIGAGALVSAGIVQFLPDARLLPFVLVVAMIALVLAAVRATPETVIERRRARLRPQRPGVPRPTRAAFALAALGVIASWSIGGLYLALGPQLAGELMHTHGELAGGAAVCALSAPAAISSLLGRELSNRTLTSAGALLLALGMALTALSLTAASAAFFLSAAAITGFGFGLAFMGALRHLSAAIPESHRGEVMSAFYVVAYLAISLPAVAAGFAAPRFGLIDTFQAFSAIVVVLALAVAVGGLRIRPPRHACTAEGV
ncbi:MAG TPA: MFS transporter [Solirubrobacteraceae bacterium]|nr:MFS transporter [Solirubrobacteraceae bacterium]